jgi:hypothetical protein
MGMMGKDMGIETLQHLSRAMPANTCIDVMNAALRVRQPNPVRQDVGPAAILEAIHRYWGANWWQAICLGFHPIADSHEMLCNAVAEKCHKLAIQNSHTGFP